MANGQLNVQSSPQAVRFALSRTITQEPRGLFARYFLAADTALQRLGLTLVEVPLSGLHSVYERNADTWNGFPPWFDPTGRESMADDAMAFVGYDEQGDPVCTAAVQVWDFGTGTLKSEFENLRLLFGDRAEAQRGRWRTEALAPMAAEITDRAIYGGGYWVRPDWRGRGIGDLVPAMVRYAAFARWPLGLYVTLGSRAFLAPELRSFYDFTDCQPGMLIMDGDHLVFRGMLVWGRTSVGVDRLADRLSALTSATTPSARRDGGQRQPLPTATDDGHAQA